MDQFLAFLKNAFLFFKFCKNVTIFRLFLKKFSFQNWRGLEKVMFRFQFDLLMSNLNLRVKTFWKKWKKWVQFFVIFFDFSILGFSNLGLDISKSNWNRRKTHFIFRRPKIEGRKNLWKFCQFWKILKIFVKNDKIDKNWKWFLGFSVIAGFTFDPHFASPCNLRS